MKDDAGNEGVEVDYNTKCACEKPSPRRVNYSMMWHEADIICHTCEGFIRYYDAG